MILMISSFERETLLKVNLNNIVKLTLKGNLTYEQQVEMKIIELKRKYNIA